MLDPYYLEPDISESDEDSINKIRRLIRLNGRRGNPWVLINDRFCKVVGNPQENDLRVYARCYGYIELGIIDLGGKLSGSLTLGDIFVPPEELVLIGQYDDKLIVFARGRDDD